MPPVHPFPSAACRWLRRRFHWPRHRRFRWRLVLATGAAATAALVVTAAAVPAVAGSPGPAGGYVPPVASPVVDPFRAPATPYGPGNRGLEYDTRPGDPVRACAAGTVTFAGRVARGNHVTVTHPDGVRTSYSHLASVRVVAGQRVAQGDVLGTAGEVLHLGARVGDTYVDPASLFGGGPVTVELLPSEVPAAGAGSDGLEERLAGVFDGGWGISLPRLPPTGDGLGWLRARARTTVQQLRDLAPGERLLEAALDLGERLLFPGPCSDGDPPVAPASQAPASGTPTSRVPAPRVPAPGPAPAPAVSVPDTGAGRPGRRSGAPGRARVDGRRVAVTVAGLGSSSQAAAIDDLRTRDLGYDDDRVVRFSYAGGRTPGSGLAVDGPVTTYDSADTQGDLRVAARRLADLVEAVLAGQPGATVDVFAHSQGGVVTRLALLELERRGAPLDRLGLVATLGTPHQGADLATAVRAANAGITSNLALDALRAVLGLSLDPDAPAVRQLAESSDVMRQLAQRGMPEGVRLVSLAARSDAVVAAPRTEVEGGTNVTVPVDGWQAHAQLVASDAATDELARALAGQPPGCEGVGDVVADVAVGHGISYVEDVGGLALTLGP